MPLNELSCNLSCLSSLNAASEPHSAHHGLSPQSPAEWLSATGKHGKHGLDDAHIQGQKSRNIVDDVQKGKSTGASLASPQHPLKGKLKCA